MQTSLSRLRRVVCNKLSARKVDFLVAGTQKGGTTALDAYLRLHPQICMAGTKEVHFFDNEQLFASPLSRRALYGLYHDNFRPQPQHRVLGESTPIYMYWADAPRRIRQYNPEMKLIILLRNPIERAYSHWNMQRQCGIEPAGFAEALQLEDRRRRIAAPLPEREFSYIDRGRYAEQLQRLWRHFPRSNTLILKSEHLRTQPAAALLRIARFLGIDPFDQVEPLEIHCRNYPRPMTSTERALLERVFRREIRAVEQLLQWDCSDWLHASDAVRSGCPDRSPAGSTPVRPRPQQRPFTNRCHTPRPR